MSNYDYEETKSQFEKYVDLISDHKNDGNLKFRKLNTNEVEMLAKGLRRAFGVPSNQSNARPDIYIPSSPLADLADGKDREIQVVGSPPVKIEGREVQKLQEQVKLYFKGEEVNEHTDPKIWNIIRHFYHLKYEGDNYKIPLDEIPKEYRGKFTEYKNYIEDQCYHLVCRFQSKAYYDNNLGLLNKPIDTIRYDAYFPKLTYHKRDNYKSHGYQKFVSYNKKLKEETELNELYKNIFRSHLKIAAKNNELYSTVVPNAFLEGLNNSEKEKAQVCYVKALIDVIEEIKNDIGKKGNSSSYAGFKGALINCPSDRIKGMVENAYNSDLLIGNNPLYAGALDELCSQITAQPTMSEPFGAIGNGALGDRAASAKDERDMRYSLGISAAVACPHYNPKLAEILGFKSFHLNIINATPHDNYHLPVWEAYGWSSQSDRTQPKIATPHDNYHLPVWGAPGRRLRNGRIQPGIASPHLREEMAAFSEHFPVWEAYGWSSQSNRTQPKIATLQRELDSRLIYAK